MKNLKYLFYTLLATSVFAACSEDTTSPAEPDLENCYNVYFPSQDNATDLTLDPAAPTTLEFKVMRSNDKDAITVPVEIIASEEDIFTASEIVFAEGQTETTFSVDFPKAALGTTYSCTLAVTDPQYVSKYTGKPAFVKFSVLRAKWIQCDPDRVITYNGQTVTGYEWFSDDVTTALFDSFDTYPVIVEVREDTIDEDYPNGENGLGGLYRMIEPWGEGVNVEIDARNPKQVFIRQQKMGLNHNTYGEFIISSLAYHYTVTGSGDPDAYYGKIENGAIVFPTDALLFAMEKYNNGSFYYANPNGKFCLEIYAAQVVDYSLILKAGEPADGTIAIAAELGTDIAKVKYAFFEGSLSVAQATEHSNDIDAGKIESKELTATGTISAQFENTGVYTMLANIYDKENQLQGYETISFGYVAAGDEKPVVLSCGVTITDKYTPQGYTSEDSAEIYIYGKEIVSGFYALIETDKMAAIENMDEYLSEEGEEFTAAQLEQINGAGYSGVIGDLVGGTEYTLVVKAFNGYVSAYATASATTNGTAHPLKRAYTASDLSEIGGGKTELFKTWNLWAVDFYDETNTKRQQFGQATFSENTEDDVDDGDDSIDAINVKGMSFGESETDDTLVWEYYGGVFYTLGNQLAGTFTYQGSTLYLMPTFIDISAGANTTGNYAMVGGSVGEGYMALVSNNSNYNINGMLFKAYADAEATNALGNWALYYNIMFEDPAVADGTTAAAAKKAMHSFRKLALNVSTPNNFVELRGRERMRALIDEMKANKRVSNAARTIEPVEMPALGVADAKVTFKPGVPQVSCDRSMLKVKGNAVRFDN